MTELSKRNICAITGRMGTFQLSYRKLNKRAQETAHSYEWLRIPAEFPSF